MIDGDSCYVNKMNKRRQNEHSEQRFRLVAELSLCLSWEGGVLN